MTLSASVQMATTGSSEPGASQSKEGKDKDAQWHTWGCQPELNLWSSSTWPHMRADFGLPCQTQLNLMRALDENSRRNELINWNLSSFLRSCFCERPAGERSWYEYGCLHRSTRPAEARGAMRFSHVKYLFALINSCRKTWLKSWIFSLILFPCRLRRFS